MSDLWLEGPDPEGSGVQRHNVYRGGAHPCCPCQACDDDLRQQFDRIEELEAGILAAADELLPAMENGHDLMVGYDLLRNLATPLYSER